MTQAPEQGELAAALTAMLRDLAAAHRRMADGETVALAPLGAALVDICVRLQRLPPGEGSAFMPQLNEVARLLDWLKETIEEQRRGLDRRIAAVEAGASDV